MANLLDTTVLIDWARGSEEAVRVVDAELATGVQPTISVISAMELIAGCRDANEVRRAQKLVARFHALPLTAGISDRAYQLMVSFSKSHGMMIPDALIAATAIEENLTLLTHNVRHFSMIPGFRTEKPY